MARIIVFSVSAITSFLLARFVTAKKYCIFGLLLSWIIGTNIAIFISSVVKPNVPHPGRGVQGELTEYSLQVITSGFWIALLGAGIGAAISIFLCSKSKS